MAFEFESRVRYSEMDLDKKLTIVSLVDYFQDCSSFQSEMCGHGIDYLKEQHRAWMVLSWQIDIIRRPMMGEKVTAATWPYGFKAFYGYRNFALLDENREYLAKANSVWVFMDTETGHPVKVSPENISGYEVEEQLPMECFSRKISMPGNCISGDAFQVCRHHLDTNNHVNNGQYIRMAEEFLPEGFETGRLRVEYRRQAKLHDTIVPMVHKTQDEITVGLCDEAGKPYAVMVFSRNLSAEEQREAVCY